jgi:general secretion pathway protein A
MYTEHFGFTEPPFSITPDPRYIYMSQRHREALAHMVYGVRENGGFVQLTGEVGTGKTTVIRVVTELLPKKVDVALILNPRVTARELLAAVCDELGVSYARDGDSDKELIDALNEHLLRSFSKGRRTVVIVDEAQNLSVPVLEQIRLLTNLETSKHKLLQIFLVGQPELKTLLEHNDLRQVAQRITARYHLAPLSQVETQEYIRHRLQVAGVKRRLFSDRAERRVHRLSGGVPRLINIICDRALLGAYSLGTASLDAPIVSKAAREVTGELPTHWKRSPTLYAVAAGLTGLAVGLGSWTLLERPAATQQTPSAPISEGALSRVAPAGKVTGTIGVEALRPQPPLLQKPTPESATGVALQPRVVAEPLSSMKTAPASPLGVDSAGTSPARTLDDMLMDSTAQTSTQSAFEQLLAYWGIVHSEPPTDSQDMCNWIAGKGLRCLYRSGSLDDLRNINRPAVVELVDTRGAPHHVIMSRLDSTRATVDVGGEAVTFKREEVLRHWSGDFIALWQPPLDDVEGIYPWTRGRAVLWLRERLAKINGVALSATPSETYDDDLKGQVMAFQRHNNLEQDGIVGTQTFIRLNGAVHGARIPLLASAADG